MLNETRTEKNPRGLKEVVQQLISRPLMNHSLGCRCSFTLVLQQMCYLIDLFLAQQSDALCTDYRLQSQVVLIGSSLKCLCSSYCCQLSLQYSFLRFSSHTAAEKITNQMSTIGKPLDITDCNKQYRYTLYSSSDSCRVSSFSVCDTHTHSLLGGLLAAAGRGLRGQESKEGGSVNPRTSTRN